MPEAAENTGADSASHAPAPSHPSPAAPGTSGLTVARPARTAYLPQLDGLRALAIVMVFLHHAYSLPLLWSGVDLFFILSGFLITNILLRDSGRMRFGELLKHFYLRRAQRILPAYAVCLALVALLGHDPWRTLWPFYAFFLQNVPYALHMLGWTPLLPLWSLAVEQHFYLFWPFLVFFLPRRFLAPCLVAILIAVPLLRAACTPFLHYPEETYALTPFRIDTMAAGALSALLLPRCAPAKARQWALLSIAAGLLAYLVLGPHAWFRRDANTVIFNGLAYSLNLLILGGLFVCVTLAQPGSWLYRLFAFSALRALGRISYAFYLLHLLVLMQVNAHLAPALAAPFAFLVTIGLATLSWLALEKPILSLGGGHRGAALKVRST